MPRLIDNAICLREVDWSESSQVVALLTEAHGKVRGLAKGSRRQSPSAIARFSGGINLLNLGQVIVMTKPATELAVVAEWDLRHDFFHLRKNLNTQWLAMYAAELAGALLADEDPHPAMFIALRSFLNESVEPGAAGRALLRFQWSALSDAGYRPELDRDVADDKILVTAKAYSFDPRLGGLTTRNGMGDERWRVRDETVKLLRRVALSKSALPDDLDEPAVLRANRLLCTYARAILDKELPTMRVLLGPGSAPLGNLSQR